MKTLSQDHTGRTFESLAAMARAWGLHACTVSSRLDQGWTVEQALTINPSSKDKVNKPGRKSDRLVKDHLGNVYESDSEMAKAWGLKGGLIRRRRACGWSLKETLTVCPGGRRTVLAPNGKTFRSHQEMCKAYGINYELFHSRRKRGHNLEDCLKPSRRYHKK